MTTDPFLRQRINELSGLTVYGQKDGTTTPVAANTWTALNITGLPSPLEYAERITAYKVSTSTSDFKIRIIANSEKIFPYGNSTEILSGVDMFLQFSIMLPAGTTFSIEVFSETGGTALLDYISLIEVRGYDHS